MIEHACKQGSIGVGRSFHGNYVLVQATDDSGQVRVVLTVEEAEVLKRQLTRAIEGRNERSEIGPW